MTRDQQVFEMIRDTIAGFADELQGYAVFLFGSRADGTMCARSDFDIGVLGEGPLPVGLFSRIADRLDELPTLYRIDWVDLATVSERFRAEALRRRVRIHGVVPP